MTTPSLFLRRATSATACLVAAGLIVAGFSVPANAAGTDFVPVVGIGSNDYSQLSDLRTAIGHSTVIDVAVSNQEIVMLLDNNTVIKSQVAYGGPDLAAFNALIGDHEVLDLDAGYTSVLALLDDGTVVARPSSNPSAVDSGLAAALSGKTATQISTGRHFAAALLDDGNAVAWGSDYQNAVSDVANAGIDGNAKQVEAGDTHAVVLLDDGSVTGWGFNGSGQVSGAAAAIGDAQAVDVTASQAGSYALLDDGSFVAWGNNKAAIKATVDAQIGDREIADIDAASGSLTIIFTDGSAVGIDTFSATVEADLATEIGDSRVVQAASGEFNSVVRLAQAEAHFNIAGEPTTSVIATIGDRVSVEAAGLLGDIDFTIDFDTTELVSGSTSASGEIDEAIAIPVGTPAGQHVVTLTAGDATYTADVTVGASMAGSVPTISGEPVVGSTLTAVRGAWTPGATFTYAWLRNGKAISGATAATYTLTASDLATQIQVKVTGSKTGFAKLSKTSVKTAKVAAGTLTVGDVWISGDDVVGETLTAHAEGWSPVTPKVSYQWYANGKAISKATKSTYVIPGTLADKAISLRVTGTLKGYTTVSASDGGNEFVERAQLQLDDYFVAGTPAVGKTLTIARANEGIQTASVTLEYQWMRNNEPIDGATKSTYKPIKADVGSYVYARIYASRTGYVPVATTSYYVQVFATQVKAGTVKITGTAKVGKTLTVTITGGDPEADVIYIWTKTKGATTSGVLFGEPTYTIQPEDKGYTIAVQAYFSKSGFASTQVTSKSTKKVAG